MCAANQRRCGTESFGFAAGESCSTLEPSSVDGAASCDIARGSFFGLGISGFARSIRSGVQYFSFALGVSTGLGVVVDCAKARHERTVRLAQNAAAAINPILGFQLKNAPLARERHTPMRGHCNDA